MSVDPYAMCPCGSGKKLKFCCSDLVADIEKIHRMVEGDQPRAALQHAEQTLKKRPGRPSLLDLKAMLEVTLGKLDEAEKTVVELLEKDPENPSAHAQQAILWCAQGNGDSAIEPLQHALSKITENMPRRVLEAIGAVGHTLLMQGNVIAARAHLWLYQGIAGKDDTRALELLMRLNQLPSLPLLLRDHLYMSEAPEGHPAENEHSYAQALAARGLWGPASAVFDKLCDEHNDLPTLHYNRALCHGWIGDLATFAQAMHEFARLDVPLDDAVEAEALAQVVDPAIEDPRQDIVLLTYPITDEEELTARLTRNPVFVSAPIHPDDLDGDAPPPRATFNLLDRPLPESGQDITRVTAPRIVGTILQYGRQTDRQERLELELLRNEDFAEIKSDFERNLQGVIGDAEESVVDSVNATEQSLRWRWHFPQDTPPDLRRQLTSDEAREVLLEKWPETPLAVLGGRTPAATAADDTLRIPLMAAVMTLEQASHNHHQAATYAQLRERLGLPEQAPIEPDQVDADRLPLTRVARIDAAGLSDDDLQKLYQRAAMAGATEAIKLLGEQVIQRPAMADKIDIEQAYRRLAVLQPDVASTRALLDKARAHAEANGKSTAPWDLLEVERCLYAGDGEGVERMLAHIRDEHFNEPGVAEELYGLFYSLGLMPEDAAPGEMPAAAPGPAAEASSSKIWTPDAERPQAGQQKLWTPS